MLSQAGDDFICGMDHLTHDLRFDCLVLDRPLLFVSMNPLGEGIVIDESEGFQCVVPAVHLGRVFQRGDGQEHRLQRRALHGARRHPPPINLIQVPVTVEPVVAGIKAGRPQIHIDRHE